MGQQAILHSSRLSRPFLVQVARVVAPDRPAHLGRLPWPRPRRFWAPRLVWLSSGYRVPPEGHRLGSAPPCNRRVGVVGVGAAILRQAPKSRLVEAPAAWGGKGESVARAARACRAAPVRAVKMGLWALQDSADMAAGAAEGAAAEAWDGPPPEAVADRVGPVARDRTV
jgi:hypothetical protein